MSLQAQYTISHEHEVEQQANIKDYPAFVSF